MIGRHPNILLNPSMERRVIRVRRHWAQMIKPMLQTFAVVAVTYLASYLLGKVGKDLWLPQSLLWYAAVAAVVRLGWKVLEWWLEVIIVTDKRFMITSGIIETKNSMMPIGKVTDLSFLRPVVGQVFGYGTLRVESAGQKQDLETIKYLPQPEAVFMAISELIFGDKKRPSHNLARPPVSRQPRWSFRRRSDPQVP